jgi:hypothetical protein
VVLLLFFGGASLLHSQLHMLLALPESSQQSYVDNLIAVLGLAKVGCCCSVRINCFGWTVALGVSWTT